MKKLLKLYLGNFFWKNYIIIIRKSIYITILYINIK